MTFSPKLFIELYTGVSNLSSSFSVLGCLTYLSMYLPIYTSQQMTLKWTSRYDIGIRYKEFSSQSAYYLVLLRLIVVQSMLLEQSNERYRVAA